MSRTYRWPQGAIVYQIYPRSFYDSNGDGIGDIPGITAKLDHLKSLHVNAIWLSPFYPSPMADFGYDVADYGDVDPIFGTLADMDQLVKKAHAKDIKIIVDLVPNHSSDEHVWFRQSRQSREDKYSDWYIWKDPKGYDKNNKPIPPNNWLDIFTAKSAWEWEPARQQFYLHSFDVHQPDLNWSNPEVREAIKAVMRFWLNRGVDGFRVDAVPYMAKDPLFRDDPPNPNYIEGTYLPYDKILHVNNHGWPPMYAYLAEMASVLKEKKYQQSERFMVMEAYPRTDQHIDEYLAFYEGVDPEVAAPFNFEGLNLPWNAEDWQAYLHEFHDQLKKISPTGVSSYAFGNHDQPRIVSRLGSEAAARSAAVLLLTLPGMVYIYNGEEIGMVNGKIPPEMVQDPGAVGGGGRDPERTPLQWTPGPNAGFSTADFTWLPIADNYKTHNVLSESEDPNSFLSLYQQLGQLRNQHASIKHGDLAVLATGSSKVLAFTRRHEDECHLVLINFSDKSASLTLGTDTEPKELVLSTHADTKIKPNKAGKIELQANEAAIFLC